MSDPSAAPSSDADDAKRAAAHAAVELVRDGMRLGLGTGSTTAFAIEALGARVRRDGLRVVGVPTSFQAERLARQAGVPLTTFDAIGLDTLPSSEPVLHLAFDGADEVDPEGRLIKGRGAAHVREKVVAALAARFVVLIDPSKEVVRLGTRMPVPVEVLPMAAPAVERALRRLGAETSLRQGEAKDGPVVTDQGLWVVDARFPSIAAPEALAAEIDRTPGVLGHGLFLDLTTDVLVGEPGGSVRHRVHRRSA